MTPDGISLSHRPRRSARIWLQHGGLKLTLDVGPIIAAAISGLAAIIVALTQVSRGQEATVSSRLWTCLLVFGLGLICGLVISPLLPSISRPQVAITSPAGGAVVDIPTMVQGTSRNVPRNRAMWVLVFSHSSGRFFPQRSAAQAQESGNWFSLAEFWPLETTGSKFDILVLLADAKAQENLSDFGRSSDKEMLRLGLDAIPDGAREYGRVTVSTK